MNNFTIDKLEVTPNSTASATFNFSYDNLSTSSYDKYIPVGMRYKFLITYPNEKETTIEDVIRDSNYGETITFNVGDKLGNVKIKVSSVDFPSITQEQIVKVTDSPSQNVFLTPEPLVQDSIATPSSLPATTSATEN